MVLHGARLAPHVHEHDTRAATGHDLEHPRAATAGHVVHEAGPGSERSFGDARPGRVD